MALAAFLQQDSPLYSCSNYDEDCLNYLYINLLGVEEKNDIS